MLDFSSENSPNPAKLIDSLRYLGYDNDSAIADIVDNSWDAQANRVAVHIEGRGADLTIAIADDGLGMDEKTLDQALRLGSIVERNPNADLGKYGMGLVTASLSICRRTEVITRRKGGPLLYSVIDVDEVKEKNFFGKYLGEADADAIANFKAFGDMPSGTVVILSKCDNAHSPNPTIISRNLKDHLGQVFRFFLSSKKSLVINSESISPIDPLMIEEGTEIRGDSEYPITLIDSSGQQRTELIRVRVGLLPDFGPDGNKQRGMNVRSQGFYVLRNFREVAASETFRVFSRHNDFNRVRAELFFPATLDEVMGVNFTKHSLKPKESVLKLLDEVARGQFNTLRKQIQSEQKRVENSNVSHDEAARLIGQKANLLEKPLIVREKRNSPDQEGQPRPEAQGGTKERNNYGNTQQKETAIDARFETFSMTSAGPIYDADLEGKTVVIKWNVDHPFYQRFILENQDNLGLVSATDFLIYSLASAELKYFNDDDSVVLLENLRSAISNNMRTLLS